jgi:predicted RNA-binding protein with PIN domain
VALLIDGYNLMYAVGVFPASAERSAFDAARRQFLDWLSGQPALKGLPVRVVLDAQYATRDHGTTTHRGLVVTYTFNQTADDLIETLIATDKNPQRLRVVSNDHRIRTAARKGRCQVLSCEQFIDWLQAGGRSGDEKPTPVPLPSADKPVPLSSEMDEYLKAFTVPLPSSVTKLK